MKVVLYSESRLQGDIVELDYGKYDYDRLCGSHIVRSAKLGGNVYVSLFSCANFSGTKVVLSNNSKVTTYKPNINNICFAVKSIIVDYECPFNTDNPKSCRLQGSCNNYKKCNDKCINREYEILQESFTRPNGIEVYYTYYKVIPDCNEIRPFTNPVFFIIGDIGFDKNLYSCLQRRLAQLQISSLIVEQKGVGLANDEDVDITWMNVIEDYRYAAYRLRLFGKRPYIIGYGFGGILAQLWAFTYSDEPRAIIVVNSAPITEYFTTYNQLKETFDQWLADKITYKSFAYTLTNAM